MYRCGTYFSLRIRDIYMGRLRQRCTYLLLSCGGSRTTVVFPRYTQLCMPGGRSRCHSTSFDRSFPSPSLSSNLPEDLKNVEARPNPTPTIGREKHVSETSTAGILHLDTAASRGTEVDIMPWTFGLHDYSHPASLASNAVITEAGLSRPRALRTDG